MNYPTIPIAIINVPIDWVSILAALFAAFLGAAAAFALGALKERIRRREQHLATLNLAVYGLLMSSELLLNFKKQYLINFEAEFSRALAELSKVRLNPADQTLDEIMLSVSDIFSQINKKNSTLNAVFQTWQVLDFSLMPTPRELAFTILNATEIMRLILVARTEADQVTQRIILRNLKVQTFNQSGLIENSSPDKKLKTALYWYEMLDIRVIIGEHVDTALVVSAEALDEIYEYQKSHFPKRNRIVRLFLGEETWTRGEIPDDWKKYMPDKKSYAHILKAAKDHKE